VARQDGFELGPVEIRLRAKTNTLTDGPLDPRERQLRIAKIEMAVKLRNRFTEAQLAVLERGLATCPVQNTLARPPRIVTTLDISP